jgi:hypothetical protein
MDYIRDAWKKGQGSRVRREQCGWSFSPEQRFDWDVDLQTQETCSKCNTQFKRDKDQSCCYECFEGLDDTAFAQLEERVEAFNVTVEESKDGPEKRLDVDEVYLVNATVDGTVYYGVMRCTASFEPNEWSSTPHDDYSVKCTFYKTAAERESDPLWSF